ncbi:hypothetical protein CK203_012456 [Vitis vinifera]|uniref:Uncharacterized protein n=1 Tax=Vitis vinifera TaxID=29760 RepID=A0A438JLE6_VITVI|nr:hypothetical protein CK203_012456 [Vitis vinifera]
MLHSKELLEKSKFERELKRLECSINYEGGMKQKGSVQGKGRQIETKLQCMTDSIARSIGSGRFLGWKAMNAEGASEGGILTLLCSRGKGSSQRRISSAMRKFAETVDDLGLVDLPLQGGDFTWNEGLHNQTWARLDSWWQGIDVRGSASYKLATKMKEIKQKLKVWNREVFGAHRRNNCMERIKINGEWLLEEQEIREGIANAFKELLSEDTGWKADIGIFNLIRSVKKRLRYWRGPLQRMKFMGL